MSEASILPGFLRGVPVSGEEDAGYLNATSGILGLGASVRVVVVFNELLASRAFCSLVWILSIDDVACW